MSFWRPTLTVTCTTITRTISAKLDLSHLTCNLQPLRPGLEFRLPLKDDGLLLMNKVDEFDIRRRGGDNFRCQG